MAGTIVGVSLSGQIKDYLGIQHFLYLAESIFENAINQVGNVGQAFILVELKDKTLELMAKLIPGNRQQPSAGLFRSMFVYAIGPEKYNAISIICEEMIDNLVEAWDDSTVEDSRQSVKTFLKLDSADFMTAPENSMAQMWAKRAKLTSGLL
jgi:hypothetical protein